ncbi:hypothetical protein HNP49_003205 [Pseudomonas fluvialis]|uniref:Ankyrin repeat domain-containing protein n=1 Tax=Pseudomonas fluvialis TaxID=1793966 RepID=A0A7X0BU99_9PSED|nr:hypothetical protein [Pseudomonas fluvialis]MBB6343011.1 hypothetical protein [Pseudomonas fluvialis]MBB6343017.1 hypothetical protein [Pseudomonas fluvialis]
MATLTREDLLEKLENIEFYDEVKADLDFYLSHYILTKDLPSIQKLLAAGANPNPENDLDDYILYLLHEYQVEKSTRGTLILEITEMLLKYGANPNRVTTNNLRAYDYSVTQHKCAEFSQLLK